MYIINLIFIFNTIKTIPERFRPSIEDDMSA